MFKVSDPGETRGNSVTAREILDKASKDVDSGLANDPQLQAQMMNTMDIVYENLGLFGQAEPLLRHALEIRRDILGNSNKDTLKSMYQLSEVLTWKGDAAEAEKLCRESFEGRKTVRARKSRHPDLDELAGVDPIDRGTDPEAEKWALGTVETT